MKAPFFTVLMPVYNGEATLRSAVRDILRQTFQDWELLLVNDGSTDGTSEIAASFLDPRIRILNLGKNAGLVPALNAGLNDARGQWVARMDADDRCSPKRLAVQHERIAAQPDVVLHYSTAWLLDIRGWVKGRLRPACNDLDLRWELCFRNPVPHSSATFPVALVRDHLGGYAGDNVTADFDLWSRMLQHGKASGFCGALVSYRIHRGSIMGRENRLAERPSDGGLKNLLARNLVRWANAENEEADFLATFVLHPTSVGGKRYVELTGDLLSGMQDRHPSRKVMGEIDFTILNRAYAVSPECGKSLYRELSRSTLSRSKSLPAVRTPILRLIHSLRGSLSRS